MYTSGIENFSELSQANRGPGIDIIEDSAIAVLLLISASGSLTRKTWRDFRPWFLQRFGIPTGEQLANDLFSALRASMLLGPDISRRFVPRPNPVQRHPVNPFLSALFAEEMLSRLGVRTAVSTIVEREAAQNLDAHIVKSGKPGGRLKWISTAAPEGLYARLNAWAASPEGQYALVAPIIPNAASIDYIRRIVLSMNETFDVRDVFPLDLTDYSFSIRDSRVSLLVSEVSKSCGMADKLFEKFRPSETELTAIRDAIRWNSTPYLRIHAARAFLGLTCAHFSNVLCTRDAQLISVDHDTCYFENGDDLRMIFRFVNPESQVFRILCEIAEALSEEDIRAAVATIPNHPACGSSAGAIADYFAKRLRLFRNLCASLCQPEAGPLAVGT